MKLLVFVVLTCAATAVAALAQFDDVEIETIALGPGLWMLQGRGGNIGVSAGTDGVLLIDDQFAPLTGKITAAVSKLSDRPIRFVLNTHWHGDHTGGNENLGQAGAVIVAHDNVRQQMSVEHFFALGDRKIPPSPAGALPILTFTESVTFHLNGDEIHVTHVPTAHTDGDSLVHFRKANVLHLGDLFFNGMYPFIDVDSGGSIDGVIAAVGRALEIAGAETKIIPGHGPLSGRSELVVYRDMLVSVRNAIAPLVAEGRSLDEVLAARPSAGFDEAWGGGFIDPENMVKLVYRSLSR